MLRPITLEAVAVHYGEHAALEHVSISIEPGTTVAVIGPNGSGKSTLLRAMSGLVPPTVGRIDLGGHDVALVLQATDVDRSLPITVTETVRMARYAVRGVLRRLRADDHAAVADALARLDIADLGGRQLHELSGGQRQRVLVAQGLAQAASLLLLDEPVTGLDVTSRQRILDAIESERAAGHTVLMTTHHLDDARLCDRVLLLAGTTIAYGTPDEVLVEDSLRLAFGGKVLRLGSGELLVDDPHHSH